MRLSEMQPQPRCPIICQDPDTGEHVLCARWENHTDDHLSYQDVVAGMYTALCESRGLDPDDTLRTLGGVVIVAQAKGWYRRLVLDDDTVSA